MNKNIFAESLFGLNVNSQATTNVNQIQERFHEFSESWEKFQARYEKVEEEFKLVMCQTLVSYMEMQKKLMTDLLATEKSLMQQYTSCINDLLGECRNSIANISKESQIYKENLGKEEAILPNKKLHNFDVFKQVRSESAQKEKNIFFPEGLNAQNKSNKESTNPFLDMMGSHKKGKKTVQLSDDDEEMSVVKT